MQLHGYRLTIFCISETKDEIVNLNTAYAKESPPPKTFGNSSEQLVSSLQDEIIALQARYQREFDKLEKENRELRKQNILLRGGRDIASLKKTKVKITIIIII